MDQVPFLALKQFKFDNLTEIFGEEIFMVEAGVELVDPIDLTEITLFTKAGPGQPPMGKIHVGRALW